MGIDELKAIL